MFDFGPLAAQNDRDLLSYFHATKQSYSLIDFSSKKHSFIFVARPGSGKTALLKWLDTPATDRLTLVVGAEKTRLSSSDSMLNAGDIRVMVAAELYTALISTIVEREQHGSSQFLKEAKGFLSNKDWKQSVGKFFSQNFVGISILGCGFTLKPEDRRSYLQELRRTNRLSAARNILEGMIAKKNVVLVLDDPEFIVGEGLDDVTPENARRLGAFLSVLAEVHSIGIRVIVFLKEHILQNIRAHYTDFQHFADRIEGLEWTADDLIQMLQCRVLTRLKTKWEQVFDFSPKVLQEKIFPFLINGPRDLLTLCNLGGKEAGKITLARLEKVLRAYRADKWRDLSTYYGTQWPAIDQFTRAMVDMLKAKYNTNSIPVGEVKAEFEAQFGNPQSDIHSLRKKIAWVDSAKWELPTVDEKLFVIGCLGYVLEKEYLYPWAGRDIDRFRLADAHFISPVFV